MANENNSGEQQDPQNETGGGNHQHEQPIGFSGTFVPREGSTPLPRDRNFHYPNGYRLAGDGRQW